MVTNLVIFDIIYEYVRCTDMTEYPTYAVCTASRMKSCDTILLPVSRLLHPYCDDDIVVRLCSAFRGLRSHYYQLSEA